MDTIKLTYEDFDIMSGDLFYSSMLDMNYRQFRTRYPDHVAHEKFIYNGDSDSLRLLIRRHSAHRRKYVLEVVLSVPKFLNGNNLHSIYNAEQLIEKLSKTLLSCGVEIDQKTIRRPYISRVDYAHNFAPRGDIDEFIDNIEKICATKNFKNEKLTYPDGGAQIRHYNNSTYTTIYNKSHELVAGSSNKTQKNLKKIPEKLLRIEYRMLKRQTAHKNIGGVLDQQPPFTFEDLLSKRVTYSLLNYSVGRLLPNYMIKLVCTGNSDIAAIRTHLDDIRHANGYKFRGDFYRYLYALIEGDAQALAAINIGKQKRYRSKLKLIMSSFEPTSQPAIDMLNLKLELQEKASR